MVTPRRCRDGACIPLCPSHRPWPGSKPPPSVSKCKQRQPAARRWPGYQCATRSSWLPARKPSRDLRWPQLLQCACTAWEGGGGRSLGGRGGKSGGNFLGAHQRECGAPGRDNELVIAKCHAATWDGSQEVPRQQLGGSTFTEVVWSGLRGCM